MTDPTERPTSMLRSLGPGLLFAGAAVGVSHLVQATRAGADLVSAACAALGQSEVRRCSCTCSEARRISTERRCDCHGLA